MVYFLVLGGMATGVAIWMIFSTYGAQGGFVIGSLIMVLTIFAFCFHRDLLADYFDSPLTTQARVSWKMHQHMGEHELRTMEFEGLEGTFHVSRRQYKNFTMGDIVSITYHRRTQIVEDIQKIFTPQIHTPSR